MNRASLFGLIVLASLFAWCTPLSSQYVDIDISVLTCTPGDQIYSMYGHSAVRIKGKAGDDQIDFVYNYGTFEYGDNFTWKFTKGQLNYMLSRQDYEIFEHEYFYYNRGIREQTLNLSNQQKLEVFQALQKNFQPDNRYYLYDFFYDNCATRIRDILQNTIGDSLAFIPPENVDMTYREMIDIYQQQSPWIDFGIDVALGLPCDKKMGEQGDMFIPDYLYEQLGRATINSLPLVSRDVEILPQEIYEKSEPVFTPSLVIWIFCGICLAIGIVGLKRPKLFNIMARLILAIYGLIGAFLLFLWIGTDHTATADNMNLLWAFPLHLVMAFASWRKNWQHSYFKFGFLLALVLLVSWFMIPQDFHPAILPLLILFAFIAGRIGLSPIEGGERL